MQPRAWATVAGLLVVLSATPARAAAVDQAYQSGLAHYFAGRYTQAIEAFERVAALPMRDPALYYNLGCAYFRAGRLGHAVLNFERALALDPDAEDARFNLATARDRASRVGRDVLRGVAQDPLWVAAVSILSAQSWVVVFLASWWVLALLVVLLRRTGPGAARAGLVAVTSFCALVVLGSAGMLAGRVFLAERARTGIILPERLAVHEGPAATARTTFQLHAGLRVRVRQTLGEWTRIRLANGLEGWVRQRDLGLL